MELLLLGRVLQGVSAGFIPVGFAIVRDELPERRVPAGLGLVSAMLGLGSGTGVLLAGPIAGHLGWRWLFWLTLAVAVVATAATVAFVHESATRRAGRVDVLGGTLLSVTLIAALMAISWASDWGVLDPRTLALLAAALVCLLAWLGVELRTDQPLVDLQMMRVRGVWTTNLVAVFVGVGMFAAFALIPQFVQEPKATGYGFDASISEAGLYLLPMTSMLLVVGSQVGRLERLLGARGMLTVAISVSGLAWLLLVFRHGEAWHLYVASGLVGVGNGLALAALPILITVNVLPGQTGIANGMNNVMRTLGGAVGAQIVATFVDRSSGPGGHGEHGYKLAFLAGAVALGLALVASLLVPAQPQPRT